MADLFDNPMGLMGFEFVEFASPTPGVLEPVFEALGFQRVAVHRSKDVALYRQGEINFIINNEPKSYAAYFAAEHGPSACGLQARPGTRRPGGRDPDRPDGAAPAGHQGHRRCTALPDRPFRRRQVDL
jgi:hypothetical protein